MGFAWVEETVGRETGMPIFESNGEVAEAIRKTVVGDEVFGVLDNSINEMTEAANPSEL